MRHASHVIAGGLVWALALAIIAPAHAELARFRQGEAGYAGTRAAGISTLSAAEYNGFNGSTFVDDADWCIGDLPAQGYQEEILLAFDGIRIPEGARLVAARLRILTSSWESGQRVWGQYLKVAWAPNPGQNGAGLGWARRDTGLPWAAPGARGEGHDVHAGLTFTSEPQRAVGEQTTTLALDVGLVSQWLADSSTNHGVLLRVDLTDHHTGFVPPQRSMPGKRPQLELEYDFAVPDAGTPTPQDAGPPNPQDAGTPTPQDAGPPTPQDAGAPTPQDAGTSTPQDAGTPNPQDAGTPTPQDAGTPNPQDAGTPTEPTQTGGCAAGGTGPGFGFAWLWAIALLSLRSARRRAQPQGLTVVP